MLIVKRSISWILWSSSIIASQRSVEPSEKRRQQCLFLAKGVLNTLCSSVLYRRRRGITGFFGFLTSNSFLVFVTFFLLACRGYLLDSFWRPGCSQSKQGNWGMAGICGLGKVCRWCHFWLAREYYWHLHAFLEDDPGGVLVPEAAWLKVLVELSLCFYGSIGLTFFMKLRMVFHQEGGDGLHKASQRMSYLKIWTGSEKTFFEGC